MNASRIAQLATVATLLIASVANAATEITLRAAAAPPRAVVRLGDVADIACDNSQEQNRLAAIPLLPSPSAGSQRFLRKREVEDLLAAHGIAMNKIMMAGADQVTISRAEATTPNNASKSFTSAPRRLNRHAALLAGHVEREAPAAQAQSSPDQSASDPVQAKTEADVQAMITRHLQTKSDDVRDMKISCEVADRHLALLANATSSLVCEGGNAPYTGRQRFTISFTTNDGPAQFPVYAEVQPPSVPVVVALRPLARGDLITAADVELQDVGYVRKASDRRLPAETVGSVIGMEAGRAIPAGAIVFADLVQSPMLVKRGDLVSISTRGGGFRVRVSARARQDGARGDLVQVESLETKDRFDVRVVGVRQAEIAVLAPPPHRDAQPVETAKR